VAWAGQAGLRDLPERVRVRAVYAGPRRQDIRFSALYVLPAD
jgi:hypothetical protein